METKLYTQEQVHSIAQQVASKISAKDVSIEHAIELVKFYGDSKMYIDSEKVVKLIYAETVGKIVVDTEIILPIPRIQDLRTRRLDGETLSDDENMLIHDFMCLSDKEYRKAWITIEKRLASDGLDLIK